MGNKKEINSKINKLEKELSQLKELVNKDEIVDLFKIDKYSEVCKQLKIVEKTESNFDTLKEFRYHQIQNIAKLFNGNSTNNIYYPYFTKNGSGLVFCRSSYVVGYYYGQVAYYKNRITSDYIGKTFINIYNDLK